MIDFIAAQLAKFDALAEKIQTHPEYYLAFDSTFLSTKTICLKLNSEFTYPLPPFSTMFPALIDLDEYKAIKKAKAKNDNFMAVVQKIPMDKNATDINSFLMDLDLAMDFHQIPELLKKEFAGELKLGHLDSKCKTYTHFRSEIQADERFGLVAEAVNSAVIEVRKVYFPV